MRDERAEGQLARVVRERHLQNGRIAPRVEEPGVVVAVDMDERQRAGFEEVDDLPPPLVHVVELDHQAADPGRHAAPDRSGYGIPGP